MPMFAWSACLVCVVAVLAAAPALAQTADRDDPSFWAVTGVSPDDALNLRAAPNANSRPIAKIPFNARGIKNHGCPNHVTFEQWKRMTQAQRDLAARSRWCEVEYKGMRGWVAGRFLKEEDEN
ncbi:MAG: SH3 domain-containing protein [Hyphomicrobiaceae bacterium]|nr:SH3 domain-containing protein [Hyphomicrobiaceae bacterium]